MSSDLGQVALVHDWLNQVGGAEYVLETLVRMFPAAPVYTSMYAPDKMPPAYRAWANDIATWPKSICPKTPIRETASAQNRRMLVVKLNPVVDGAPWAPSGDSRPCILRTPAHDGFDRQYRSLHHLNPRRISLQSISTQANRLPQIRASGSPP